MKTKTLILAGLALAGLTVALVRGHTVAAKSPGVVQSSQTRDWAVAGAGRVEPYSEDVKLGAELSGKLKAVYVEEGERIKAGQLLAELVNSDYHAQVAAAQAEVLQKDAELRKVINGARREQRREAWSSVKEAEAVMNNAQTEMVRRQQLFAAGVVSQEEADRYAKEYEVAKARYEEKVQSHALIDEAAREEDQARAEAELQSARARLEAAQAALAKTYVRAPLDGVVLRKQHRTGESVANGATVPDPIFTIGDTRALRVRVDVDEADVSKLALGERAYVTADAYGRTRFSGHVVRIGQELGRKNVRTDEPTERVDTKILETLIQLDDGTSLPIGLRVDSFILPAGR